MQNLMLTLDRWLRRHRIGVLVAWIVLVVAAVPFAAKQSEHLSGGGYSIPGSVSQKLVGRLPKIPPGAQHAMLAGVLAPTAGATPAEMQTALTKLDIAARDAANVSLSPTVRAQTRRTISAAGARQRTLVVPLAVSVNEEGATNVAGELRKRMGMHGTDDGAVGDR